MIKEIVAFTENISDSLKDFQPTPKTGLHILLDSVENGGVWSLDSQNYQYERYLGSGQESNFLRKCTRMQQSAWYILELEKGFDVPAKAIHSSSPFCVGFKRTYLKGGTKFEENKGKSQVYDRFEKYFDKALSYLSANERKERYDAFKAFFVKTEHPQAEFERVLDNIFSEQAKQKEEIIEKIKQLKKGNITESNKVQIKYLEKEVEVYEPLGNDEYIIFYLNEDLAVYKAFQEVLEQEKLFNYPQKHNIKKEGEIYGVSTFFHSHNADMPFLINRTAPFDIPSRVSLNEARQLATFRKILGNNQKLLPNPLPIFILRPELNKKQVELYNGQEGLLGYEQIISLLWETHKSDFGNYYLIFWQKSGHELIFNDVDYVASFDYQLKDSNNTPWLVEDLFSVEENKQGYKVKNLFEFQFKILTVIFNNSLIKKKGEGYIYKYFGELKKEHCSSSQNYHLILNYRKAFYDFVYKSQKHLITHKIFNEVILTNILSDIRIDKFNHTKRIHSSSIAIRKKLNIWFSLYEHFNGTFKQQSMINQLKNNREFMTQYLNGDINEEESSEENYAFAVGQLAYYLMSKSKSEDESYRRLERHFQQNKLKDFIDILKDDFIRYKHQNYTKKFRKVASWVFTNCPQDENLDKHIFQILGGIFSQNHLFH